MDSDESRDILVQLIKDEHSVIQGEAVRQLSSQDPSFVGPLLLSQLNDAGTEGIYPTSIMDPVRNQLAGGKIEIIRALGEIAYKPAAKELLPLLETENRRLFKLVIRTLIQLESKAYVPYINKHLKSGTRPLLFDICRTIAKADLVECKPALMEFISTHDRNVHPSCEYSVSTCCGLGHFNDTATVDFLLSDFKSILQEKDSIDSDKLGRWIRKYIETFEDLKCEEARPLIYESLFHWFGYGYDFSKYPVLMTTKAAIEDSINKKTIGFLSDFKISEVQTLVHIQNAKSVAVGEKPEFEFRVYVKVEYSKPSSDNSIEGILSGGDGVFPLLDQVRKTVSDSLEIPIYKVGAKSGAYVDNVDERFDSSIDFSPMASFYKFAKELPNEDDLMFLKALANSGFAKREFDKKQLNRAIEEVERKLKNTMK